MESISKDIPKSHEPTMRLYAKHNLLTRTLHSLNMVAISALIATGIVMMVGGHRLESIGRSIHEVFYFLLFGVGAVYLPSLLAGGRWKLFVPTRDTLRDAVNVVKSELGIGTHAACLAKYNGAQRLAYAAVLIMVAGEVVTGLAMAYHKELPWLVAALGGRHAVHAVHKSLMFGIIAFVVVHIIQVIRAGWPALRSMISGYDILPGTTAAAVDGAIPETDRLCTPVSPNAAHKTVDVQTRKGFMSAAAALATGLALVAFGATREAGSKRADAAGGRGGSTPAAGDRDDDDGGD